MPTLQRVYRFRMRPDREQEQALSRQAGARRFVWNWALARRKSYYAEHGTTIPAAQLSKELTALKDLPDTLWLKEIDSQLLQQTLKDLDRAFANFFARRARFPRFKSRKRDSARFRIPQRVKVKDGKVYVPKVGWVRIRQSQEVTGLTKSATFSQDACGHWYVSLVAPFEMPDTPLPKPVKKDTVGIDAGLKDFAVLSNRERIPAPRFFRKAERKLKKAQQTLSRRQRGSKRRDKARKQVARIHEQVRSRRNDFLHKLSTLIVKRFGSVCVEDLNVKGLARTKLAKSFQDAAHGEFRRQLEYKCLWQRKHFVKIDRFYPSSKRCRQCGEIHEGLSLCDRHWRCSGCGRKHDRDLNAARNIRDEGFRLLAAGHADSRNARREGVRPSHQKAILEEARIPRL